MALLRARESAMTYFRPMLNQFGLTEQQWRVIRVLQEFGKLEFRELSQICCIQPPSLTGILTRLERDALVRRQRSAIDQRRLHVSLTRKGVARFKALSDHIEVGYRALERRLGSGRFKALMSIVQELAELEPPEATRQSLRRSSRSKSLTSRQDPN